MSAKPIEDEFSGVSGASKRWRLRHPEKAKERNGKQRAKRGSIIHAAEMAAWRKKHPEFQNRYDAAYSAKIREAVFNHYGWVCSCCGETEPAFLTIDHINNDGREHSKKYSKRNLRSYRWYVREGFPKGLQTLCWNCNTAKQRLGECPHKTKDYSDRLGIG